MLMIFISVLMIEMGQNLDGNNGSLLGFRMNENVCSCCVHAWWMRFLNISVISLLKSGVRMDQKCL